MPQAKSTHTPPQRKILGARRLTLMASVAGLGVAVLLGGPGGVQSIFAPSTASPSTAYAAEVAPQPSGFADLVAKVKPAVISVRVKFQKTVTMMDDDNGNGNGNGNQFSGTPFEKFFQQFGMPNLPKRFQHHYAITGEGSGFFISPDGYAVTNYHVVENAKTVQITTDDGTKYPAKVVGTDPKTDLALIKVDGDKNFSYVKFAEHEPRIGDWVVAVGNPFGLGGTVTAGIVSARGRQLGSNVYDDYIQIDAPINKGNSGGPTFNTNGDVIGVNTAIYSPSGGSVGIGFDIPASTVKQVVAELKQNGSISRGWMGVRIQTVTQGIAESLGMKDAKGALVDEPQSDSPAAKAGIKAGDVITAVNGDAVKDSRDLAQKIGKMAPGTSVKFSILRDGNKMTITLTLGKMPSKQQQAKAGTSQDESSTDVPHLGLTLAPAKDVAGSGDKGVVVTEVEPDGPAASHGIQTGDVILGVAGKTVANVSDLRKALADAKASGKHNVLMRVKRANGTSFVALPLGKA
jgi:serine protease Do